MKWLLTLALCIGTCAIFAHGKQGTQSSLQETEDRRKEEKWKESGLIVEEARLAYFAGKLSIADSAIGRAISMFEAVGPKVSTEALTLKAEIDMASGRIEEARDTLARLPLKRMALSTRTLIVLAQSSFASHDVALGQEYLDKALHEEEKVFHFRETWNDLLSLRSSSIQSCQALMLCLMASHYYTDLKARIHYLQKAMMIAPSNTGLKVHFGDTLRRLGRWEEARLHLEPVAKGQSDSAVAAIRVLRKGPIKGQTTAGGG